MPANPYENLTAVVGLRAEAAQTGRYGQFAGSVETHRKPNVNYRPKRKRFKPPTPGSMLLSYGALESTCTTVFLTFFGFRRIDRRTPDDIESRVVWFGFRT